MRGSRIWGWGDNHNIDAVDNVPNEAGLFDYRHYCKYGFITKYYVHNKIVYLVDTYTRDNRTEISKVNTK